MSDAIAPEDAVDLTGKTVGDYQVLRKLGQGGMGAVYLARQVSLKREVALKFLRKDLAENAVALKRFQAEAEVMARVTHANIVQVFAVGEHDGQKYMALEYVEGRNLRDYLERKGPPDLPVAISILRQVAAALQRASEIGIVHRDIKPENILITRKVEVKVADFGLSRYFGGDGQPLNLPQSGMTLGTPLYMSPEQVQGKPVDHRSDIYSFGITAYHLLAGQPPFRGKTPFDVAIQHVQNQPPPLSDTRPDLPVGLCELVHKLMAKRPEDRYQTARDIIRDLVKIQKGLPVVISDGIATQVTNPGMSPNTLQQPLPQMLGLSSTAFAATSPSQQSGYFVAAPAPSGQRWTLRVIGLVMLSGIAGVGWWVFGRTHPPSDGKGAPAIIGLPDVRPPEPVLTGRERELRNLMKERSTKPGAYVDAAVELGLMLVKERRLDDAEKVFKELESERDRIGIAKSKAPPGLAAKLGQGLVLALRDKPVESNDLFLSTLNVIRPTQGILDKFLLDHPDFAQAIAEAINRNAENLVPPAKMPDRLEWLRTPGGLLRGPKS